VTCDPAADNHDIDVHLGIGRLHRNCDFEPDRDCGPLHEN
jgi:hypothetical protein